jgi:membrane-associated protease RseP (regulator of RpoE activity)
VASLLLLIAELNLFVGIFNLLPLLPLDGGHVGILAFEEARSRVYRLVGRRDPGRVDIMKVLPLTYAVVAAFVGLSLILLYAGIANPIRLQ